MERLFKKYSIYLLSIFAIVIITISLIMHSYYSNISLVSKAFNSINLEGIDNIMIVTHPTDEIIFGGAHLIKDNYLVVCITCGNDKNNTLVFIDILNKTNSVFLSTL